MDTRAATSPTGNRPYNGLLLAFFGLLGVAGAWYMRISTALNDAPVGFLDMVESGIYPNGLVMKKTFTHIKPIDEVLSILVAAFMPGTAGWDEVFYWQQAHFLVQIGSLIAIMNVEACRKRNTGSWLKYTALYSFLYQNIGGAIVLPIWMVLFHRVSGRNQYFSTGREIPLPYVRVMLPAILFIFFIPTVAMLIPVWSWKTLQNINAVWQWTPILVNVPLWFAAPAVSSSTKAEKKNADLPYLKVLYNAIMVICVANHMFTVFKIASSETPGVTLWKVFLPDPAHWLTSHSVDLLWIFQIDWIICALLHIIPATIAIYDVVRFIPETDDDPLHDRLFKGIYITAALTVFGGPGAALAGVWGWREEQMAIIEERAAGAGGRKKQ